MDLILRHARIADDLPLQNIAIQGDKIVAVEADLPLDAQNIWDLDGQVVLPGLVDLHTHLDKTYSTIHNKSGTLVEAIEVWNNYKQTRNADILYTSAIKAIKYAIGHGITAMRSHLDVLAKTDLPAIEILLDVREAVKSSIDLQYVALGAAGFSTDADSALQAALDMGVDYIGGAPSLTEDPQHAIDTVISLALKSGKPIDLHIDETEDPQMCSLEYLAEQTIEYGLQGRVTAGHCCSLGFIDAARAARVIDKVAEAEITIVTLPSCNLVLMGRGMQPTPRGITRVKDLLAKGVNVCAASDNVHDPFNPFGCYDLLQIANLNAHVAHLTGELELYTSLDMVSTYPALAFGKGDIHLQAGTIADLVILQAKRCLDSVLAPPPRLGTIKAGKVLYRAEFEQTWNL